MKSETAAYIETRTCTEIPGGYTLAPEVKVTSTYIDEAFRIFLTRAAKLADSGFVVSVEAGKPELSEMATLVATKSTGKHKFEIKATCTLISSYSLKTNLGYRGVTKAEYEKDVEQNNNLLAATSKPDSTEAAYAAAQPETMSRVVEIHYADSRNHNGYTCVEMDYTGPAYRGIAVCALQARLANLKAWGFKAKGTPKNPNWFELTRKNEKLTVYATTHNTNVPSDRPVVTELPCRAEATAAPALTERETRIGKAVQVGLVNGGKADAKKQGYIDAARGYATTPAANVVVNPLAAAPVRRTDFTEDEVQPEAFKPIPDATYTVVLSEGKYRTLKLETRKDGDLKGKTIVEFLSGPDNSLDFTGAAFYDKTNGYVGVWKRFKGSDFEQEIRNCIAIISGDPAKAGLGYAMNSGRCCRCGRTLTVPASLHAGMGPECATKGLF